MMVGLLGVLKAGGAYLPLDPAFPADRLPAFMLEDAAVAVLVTQRRLLGQLPRTDERIVCLDADWPAIAREDAAPFDGGVAPDDLAYVIYTSGSTGKPKGVQIPHRAVVNFLASMAREPGLTARRHAGGGDDAVVRHRGAGALSAARRRRARWCWLDREHGHRRSARWRRSIATSGATVVQATPRPGGCCSTAGWQGDRRLKVLCGGEALPRDLAEQLA